VSRTSDDLVGRRCTRAFSPEHCSQSSGTRFPRRSTHPAAAYTHRKLHRRR